MLQQHKTYETTFIVNASLDDPQIDAVIEKAKDVIIKNHGEVVDLVKWGRKRFAYPIRKRNNGFYVVCIFRGGGDLIAKLERHFQLEENILRFLVIALDKKALQARAAAAEKAKEAAALLASTPAPDVPALVPAPAPPSAEPNA